MRYALVAIGVIAGMVGFIGLAKLYEILIISLFNPPSDITMTPMGFFASIITYVAAGLAIAWVPNPVKKTKWEDA